MSEGAQSTTQPWHTDHLTPYDPLQRAMEVGETSVLATLSRFLKKLERWKQEAHSNILRPSRKQPIIVF